MDYEETSVKLFPHGQWHWGCDGICIDSASPGGTSRDDMYAHQNAWYMKVIAAFEWWRIVRGGDDVVQLDTLTAEQGKRVQRFFEDSDLETLDCTVDGELKLLLRYIYHTDRGRFIALIDFISKL